MNIQRNEGEILDVALHCNLKLTILFLKGPTVVDLF